MHFVLVSSPGIGRAPHWSDADALALAVELLPSAASIDWLRAALPGSVLPAAPPRVVVHPVDVRPAPVWRVAASRIDAANEFALVRLLRRMPVCAVVHLGIGGGGSPNMLWLAERMGARPIAVARAAEVVCHRGDLVHADGSACRESADPVRCQRCLATSWWRRPATNDIVNRTDLLISSLMAAAAVFVPSSADIEPLVALGIRPAAVVVAPTTSARAQHLLATGQPG